MDAKRMGQWCPWLVVGAVLFFVVGKERAWFGWAGLSSEVQSAERKLTRLQQRLQHKKSVLRTVERKMDEPALSHLQEHLLHLRAKTISEIGELQQAVMRQQHQIQTARAAMVVEQAPLEPSGVSQ